MKPFLKAVFLLFIFFLFSCKKDKKDTQPPIIAFATPASGQSFKMYDTILVTAHVSDNQHLSSINVTLTDLNHIAQQSSYSIPIQSADFILTTNYILTQFHLSTGYYYIQITADDGYNTTAAYQSIYITASPTYLWGYCVVLKNNSTIFYYNDSLQHNVPISTLSQSYNGMRYGGYYQQLYINGNGTSQAFQAYSMQTYTQNATITQAYPSISLNSNLKNYTCLYTDGYKPYVGYLNGEIYSYDYSGNPSTSYRNNSVSNTAYTPYPYRFTTTGTYGAGIFRTPNSNVSDQLITFYGSSGVYFSNKNLNGIDTVIAILPKSQDSLYVFGNYKGQARGYIYVIPSIVNPSPSIDSINMSSVSGEMLSAVLANNQYVLFSTNSNVYTYSSANSIITTLPTGTNGAQKISYQPQLNRLSIANGSNLNAYIYTVGSNTLSTIFAKSLGTTTIIDFEVITNK